MTRLDDRIREGLREAGPAAAPNLGALTDEITRRRHRRDTVRRVQMGGLTVVVLAASVVGYMALSRAFTGTDAVPVTQTSFGSDGMVVVCDTDVPGDHLCLISPDALRSGVSSDDLVPLTARDGEIVANPSVSPDGRTVVFDRVAERDDAALGVDLWRIGIDGSDERLLLERATDGSWSPDGASIVAVADGGGNPSPEQLVVIGPDGDLGSAVTLGPGSLSDPSYSPDGEAIVLAGVDDVSAGIYIVRGEGPPDRLPDSRGGNWPSWAGPDAVLYVVHPADGDALRTQGVDGVIRSEFGTGVYSADHPTLSPDGSSIAFGTVTEGQDGAVMTIPVGGGAPALIASPARFPAWVPALQLETSDPAVQIAGVPFRVCHPMTIPGSFGDGLDTLWVIEREHEVADGDCSLAEGFQYIGVGTPSHVTILSEEIHDIGQADSHAIWPFATPDLDGDGVDEIAVGIAGSRAEGYALVVPYIVANGEIAPVTFDCGPACDPVPWIGLGTFVESLSGAYCGPDGFVRWSASEGRVIGSVWSLQVDRVVRAEDVFDRVDDGTDYPADGLSELCGSPTTFPEDFANYPDEPSAEPEPTLEGEDIGIGTNVCGLERKGGLDIVPGGEREVAWTGYLVTDEGLCPERNANRQDWVVAVDATGDGLADTWTDLALANCPYTACWPLDATDLDADGDGELIVTTGFTIRDQGYFSIEAGDGGYSIAAIEVAAPGHAPASVEGDAPLETTSGGDAGYSSWIRCEGYPASPVLVHLSSEYAIEGDGPTYWHEVKFRLESDGRFHIVDTTDLTLPAGDDPGLIRSDAPACGVDFTVI